MLKVVQEGAGTNDHDGSGGTSLLDEIVRDGARQMLAAALQAEVAAYIEAHADQVDGDGRRLVVRNGSHTEREVMTSAGAVPVRAPRVNDRRFDETTGGRTRFASAILPAWSRKSPRVAEVLPLLYLHGLSSSDFAPALEQFLGSGAGLSAPTITRLTTQWQGEATAFNQRSLVDTDYVYCWVDGIHLKVRLAQDKVCLLVMIGVRTDGTKELIALAAARLLPFQAWDEWPRRAAGRRVMRVGIGGLATVGYRRSGRSRASRRLLVGGAGMLCLVGAQLATNPPGAQAAVLPAITVGEDAYVQSDQPGVNFGTAVTLNTVAGTPEASAFLKFTVSGVSGTVTKATFRAFTQTGSGSGYELHRVADSTWTEPGLTYANKPVVGATIGSAVNFTSNTWTTVDVTSVVTGNGVYSFEMNATSTNLKKYSSKESGANAPQLVLENAAPSGQPAGITAVSGTTPQSAATNTVFAVNLAAKATDSGGNPVSGASVTFTAPSSGASGAFAGGTIATTATTGANGVATASAFSANATAGTYQVTATTPGVATPVTFSLTSTAVPTSNPSAADVADSYVRSDLPADNFGTAAVLIGRTSPEIDSFIKFNVTGLNQPPLRATLRLWVETTGTTSYKVYRVTDTSWTESGLTFNDKPAFGGLLATSGATTASTWMDLDVTAAVAGNGQVSLGFTSGSTAGKNFGSREDAGHAPQLLITAPPPANGDPVIGAVGDIACDPVDPNWNNNLGQNGFCHHKATSDLALALNPTAFLTLGDHQYNGGTTSQFSASYDPTWGRLKAITKPVLGNHEFGTSGANGYFSYFGDAATPLQPGCRSNCNGWYSYNVGDWHIVALNSECDRNNGNCLAGSAQETWFKSDLQGHANACTLAYTHHPKWSSNSFATTGIDALVKDMYDYNVDLYLAGHSHTYERFAPQNPQSVRDDASGITEILVGSGGRDFSGFSTVLPNSLVRGNNTYGILKLTLHASSADFQFLRDTTSGLFSDSGTVNCH